MFAWWRRSARRQQARRVRCATPPRVEELEGRYLPATLLPGELLVSDPVAFGLGGILHVLPSQSEPSAFAWGGLLEDPAGIVARADVVFVADARAFGGSGGIIRIDPATGQQTVVTAAGLLVEPAGLAVDAAGFLYVADPEAFGGPGGIIRVDPLTGEQTAVASGGLFEDPTGVVVSAAGDLFVVDPRAFGGPGGVIRVDRLTGVQSRLTAAGWFEEPRGIALGPDGFLYVVDSAAFGGAGGVIRVDPATGQQQIVSREGLLADPSGIVYSGDGFLYAADPSAGGGPGAVIRIDPASGTQLLVASNGAFEEPSFLAVVLAAPAPQPDPDPEPDPDPDPHTDPDPVSDPDPDPVPDPDPEPDPDPNPQTDPDPVTDPEPDPVPNLDPDPPATRSAGASRPGLFYRGTWTLDRDGNRSFDAGIDWRFRFGRRGDWPLVGDWNGDGRDDVGVYRPTAGKWILDNNGNPFDGVNLVFSRRQRGRPVVGDWNGDGRDDIGLYRRGRWYLDRNGNRRFDDGRFTYGGEPGDLPLAGDWNGIGKDRVGIFRQGRWVLDRDGRRDFTRDWKRRFTFGREGDLPVPADWLVEPPAADVPGLYRRGSWRTAGGIFFFDGRGGLPLAGNWQLPELLRLAGRPHADRQTPLTTDQLQPIVDEAIRRWAATVGDLAGLLQNVRFRIVDLHGSILAAAQAGRIDIDRDAAGWGWWVDPTPASDDEFSTSDGPAAGDVDLLTVVRHELGHLIGLDHGDGAVMQPVLAAGVRW